MSLFFDASLIGWSKALLAVPTVVQCFFFSLSIGLACVMAISEIVYFVTHDEEWKLNTRFWMKLFAISLLGAILATIVMIFVIIYNWCGLWQTVPALWSMPSAIWEGATVVLEIFFLLMVIKGRKILSRSTYLIFTCLTAIGLGLVAWWPLVVNAWMEYSIGTAVNCVNSYKLSFYNLFLILFSPIVITKIIHIILGGWLVGAAFAGSMFCFFLLRRKHLKLAKRGLWLSAALGLMSLFFTMCLGDNLGYNVAKTQPMKMAAMQGLYDGGREIPFTIFGSVKIPKMLSRLATHNNRGYVPGINNVLNGGYDVPENYSPYYKKGEQALSAEAKKIQARYSMQMALKWMQLKKDTDLMTADRMQREFQMQARFYGYQGIKDKAELIPNVPVLFWSFRIMVGVGLLLYVFFGLFIYMLLKGDLEKYRWVQRMGLFLLPLTLICIFAGWMVSEMGRSPWTVMDLLPAKWAVSDIPLFQVQMEFAIVSLVLIVMLVVCVWLLLRVINRKMQENFIGEENIYRQLVEE